MIPDYYIIPGAVIAVLVLLALAFWARYKTVGPDRAMIVTGSSLGNKNASVDETGRHVKIIRGGAHLSYLYSRKRSICLYCHISSIFLLRRFIRNKACQ